MVCKTTILAGLTLIVTMLVVWSLDTNISKKNIEREVKSEALFGATRPLDVRRTPDNETECTVFSNYQTCPGDNTVIWTGHERNLGMHPWATVESGIAVNPSVPSREAYHHPSLSSVSM